MGRYPLKLSRVMRRAGPVVVLAALAVSGPVAGAGATSAQPPAPATSLPASVQTWGPLAYGDAEISTPTAWPVVYPGSDGCGPTGAGGVVLLGPFGAATWCGPGTAAAPGTASPANLVRLGPLPAGPGPSTASHPAMTIDGLAVYEGVLHGQISGTVYSVPALGVEVMVSGALARRVIGTLAPSVRDIVLGAPATGAPPTPWRTMSFAGLRFAVPPSWPVSRTAYAFACDPPDIGFATASVTLDTDTNLARLPCPYPVPPREARNGIQIDEGSAAAPNPVLPHGAPMVVHGLRLYIDGGYPFGALVIDVERPGGAAPVKVTIGLGTASTAGAVLASIAP